MKEFKDFLKKNNIKEENKIFLNKKLEEHFYYDFTRCKIKELALLSNSIKKIKIKSNEINNIYIENNYVSHCTLDLNKVKLLSLNAKARWDTKLFSLKAKKIEELVLVFKNVELLEIDAEVVSGKILIDHATLLSHDIKTQKFCKKYNVKYSLIENSSLVDL